MGIKKLQEQVPYLEALKQPRQGVRRRRALIEAGGAPLIKCLGECCHNILQGVVPVDEVTRRKLKRHAKQIREVADPKVSLKRKRAVLVQRGGFLPALLVPVLSAVSGLVGSLLNR